MSKLSSSEILKNQEEFLSLLSKVNRPGIQELITWLTEKSDFFTAPSSSRFHGAQEGGLCQHSLNVYHTMCRLKDALKDMVLPTKSFDEISDESMIVTGLLHDICKANFYKKEIKVYKDEVTGAWHHYYTYSFADGFPVGHGEKSVIMLQNFMRLSCNEILAIRWHMGVTDPGAFLSPYTKSALDDSMNNCALLNLISQADVFASYAMEPMIDQKIENLID